MTITSPPGSIIDSVGNTGWFTPARDMRIVEPFRLVGMTFGAAIDTTFWTAATTGAGSASAVATGIATVTSGTANNGYGQITTVHKARFMFVHPHLFRSVLRVTALTIADCTRRWGAFTLTATTTPEDGFYFSLAGDDTLSVNCVNNEVVTTIASGSFNGSNSEFVMDANAHVYEIVYFEERAQFIIDGILIHTFTPTTTKLSETFNHPVSVTAINAAGGTASGSIQVFAASILRLGAGETESHTYHLSGNAATHTIKLGAGKLHKVIYNNTSGTTLTIYDNTAASGTVIGVITTASASLGVWEYDSEFEIGLTLVTVGNSLDATIVYE